MSNDKIREEFEAWAKPHLIYGDDSEDVEDFNLRMECAYYISTETQAAWEAWQASRAAVVVDFSPCDVQHASYNDVDCYAIQDVKTILSRHCLRVKP